MAADAGGQLGERPCLARKVHPRTCQRREEQREGAEHQCEADPRQVRYPQRTAQVARAIYESESAELAGLRGLSAFSPALRQLEEELEAMRYDMQRDRLEALAASARMKPGLAMEDARRIMWMYTGREVYRMLVEVGGWSADKYQTWLAAALVDALVGPPERR
jgi:hypothetical protein